MRVPLAISIVAALTRPVGAQTSEDWRRADSAVVRLAPSAFPQLPTAIRRDLETRECRIPQSFLKKSPHNVLSGSFIGAKTRDWAVLCSVQGVSRILVYSDPRESRLVRPVDSLRMEPDRTYLQGGVQEGRPGKIGYSRMLGVARPVAIRHYAVAFGNPAKLPKQIDHSGIEDSFLEKASEILFFHRGAWLTLQGMD
jgi:hypothetical protein